MSDYIDRSLAEGSAPPTGELENRRDQLMATPVGQPGVRNGVKAEADTADAERKNLLAKRREQISVNDGGLPFTSGAVGSTAETPTAALLDCAFTASGIVDAPAQPNPAMAAPSLARIRRVFRPTRSPPSENTESDYLPGDHVVATVDHGIDAPAPMPPIPGFPPIRPNPYPIENDGPDQVVPLTEPFLSAANRALDRDPENFRLQMSDFSTRGRQLFTPADQRSHRTSSNMSTSSDILFSDEDGTSSSIGADSDFGDDPDEPDAIGGSAVLPPASTVTGPVEVEASIPRAEVTPYGGPYVFQVDLPRDYITAGIDVRTRVRINNVSQVTVSACGTTTHGAFNSGRNARQRRREEERYLQYRDGQRMNDFVRWHLNAAVAYSMAIPHGAAPDPDYTRVVNDMSNVLADVLFAGYAYYVIIRGRGPGIYRGTWGDIKHRVENDSRSFYQAFCQGRAARRWYRSHKMFRVDFDRVPHEGSDPLETPGPAPLSTAGPSGDAGEENSSNA